MPGAETFKSYFQNIVESLGLKSKYMSEETASNALVTGIIKKFQDYPSIIKTKENHQEHFSFLAVALKDVNMDINLLDTSK